MLFMFRVLVSEFISLAAATPTPTTTPPVTTRGSPQCCGSVVSSNSTAATAVAGLLGISLAGLDVPVGLSCSSIDALGGDCEQIRLICDEPAAEWHQLIAIDCLPFTS